MRTRQKTIFFSANLGLKITQSVNWRWRFQGDRLLYGLHVFSKDRIILLTRNGKTQHTRYSYWWLKWWRREVIVLEDRFSLYRSATKEQTKISYGGRVSHMTEISRF